MTMRTVVLPGRSRLLCLAVVCLGGSAAFAQTPSGAARRPEIVAFVHANVIPMDAERVLADQTVIVTKGVITQFGPAASVKVPAAALRVDASGQYLLPALADMHVHLLGETWNMMLPPNERSPGKDIPYETLLFPYVANGVTMVRPSPERPRTLPCDVASTAASCSAHASSSPR